MKRWTYLLALVAVVGLMAPAMACDEGKNTSCCPQAKVTVTQACDKAEKSSSCSKATLTSEKPICSKATLTSEKPICSKATLTSEKPICSKATLTSEKPICSKATLTSEKPICSKATLTSEKPICSKATLTSEKPICSKATLTSEKPICSKATLTSEKPICSKAACSLPTMTFKVGDKSTSCPKEAKTLASASGAKLHFVVLGKEYTDQQAAMTALVNEYERIAASYTEVAGGSETKTCPLTGKSYTAAKEGATYVAKEGATYTVAGRETQCSKEAAKLAGTAKAAMAKVAMTYRCGDKDFCCDKMASEAAKSEGATLTYVVSGEETSCPLHARMLLAKAKIEAANAALQKQ